MPLPNALKSRDKDLPPVLECYYLGRQDGAVELCCLPRIDFNEAIAVHPERMV